MRHGRRTCMTTADIDQALRVLNIEPLYGHSAHNHTTFRRALPFPQATAAGPVYFPEDEEIDFDRVLREEKIALPKGVSWTAHWLAVEGVQPLIPENPPAIPRDTDGDHAAKGELLKVNGVSPLVNGATALLPGGATAAAGTGAKKPTAVGTGAPATGGQQNQQVVKQVLSRELQLYYARLTSSLLPPSSDFAKRTAALASLRSDAGLQALLPYLVRWVGEGVVGALKEDAQAESEGKVLEVLLDVTSAIMDNNTLFVEPYVCPRLALLDPTINFIHSYTKYSLPSSLSSCIHHSPQVMQHNYGLQPRRPSPNSLHSIQPLTPRSPHA
jgi:transcription initiation factor TFIID subunit 6